jgi:DNA-binding NtrC family response regulator
LHSEDAGFAVETAQTCRAGLARVQAGGVDLVLLDQQLPDGQGSAVITPDLLELEAENELAAGPGSAVAPGKPTESEVLRTLDAVEAEHVQRVLNHTGGHQGKTCEILGISRPALDRKIEKYALRMP